MPKCGSSTGPEAMCTTSGRLTCGATAATEPWHSDTKHSACGGGSRSSLFGGLVLGRMGGAHPTLTGTSRHLPSSGSRPSSPTDRTGFPSPRIAALTRPTLKQNRSRRCSVRQPLNSEKAEHLKSGSRTAWPVAERSQGLNHPGFPSRSDESEPAAGCNPWNRSSRGMSWAAAWRVTGGHFDRNR